MGFGTVSACQSCGQSLTASTGAGKNEYKVLGNLIRGYKLMKDSRSVARMKFRLVAISLIGTLVAVIVHAEVGFAVEIGQIDDFEIPVVVLETEKNSSY